MRLQTAIARIRKYKPVTPTDFRWAGVPLEKEALGAGTFREAVKVKDCPLIVKFPLSEEGNSSADIPDDYPPDFSSGIRHSALEMKKITRLRRFKWMRRFLPEVYYYDRRHGIIVMRFYEEIKGAFGVANSKFVETLLKRCTGVFLTDYGECNVGAGGTEAGPVPILLDLGY